MADDLVVEVPPFQPVRLILVGLGGIGSKLADELARYMSYTDKAPKEMLLVDGDVYSQSNLDRQSVLESDVGKPKAQVWSDGLAQEFKKISFSAICGYIVPDSFLPKEDKDGTKVMTRIVPVSKLQMESAITILAVDNHKTRKMFSDYFQSTVKNGVLINGGNSEGGDGSVITAVRMGGEQIMPAIDTFHPEIREPKDKNPGELSCAELAKIDGGTQVIWANQFVAALIGNEVYCVVQGEWEKLRARGEVYFDIMQNTASPRQRFVPGKEILMPQETKKEAKEVPEAVVGDPTVEEDVLVTLGSTAATPVMVKSKPKKASPSELKVVDERGKKSKVKAKPAR